MLTRHAALQLLRRPAVLATTSTLALGALLVGGVAVAGAVSGTPDAETVDASASPSPSGGSGGNGDDNAAVAVNTRDGSSVYAVRLKVVMAGGDTVDAQNAAVAAASCTDCTTVAIALEGVLITGDAEVVAPENIALAINSGCDGCQTLAYAYQNVQTTGGKVRLTGDGRRTIAQLRAELNGLRRADLPLLEVKAAVDRIAREFAAVLRTQVVPIGKPDGSATATTADVVPTGSPSARPTSSASPSPTVSPTTSPSGTPGSSPTATPTG